MERTLRGMIVGLLVLCLAAGLWAKPDAAWAEAASKEGGAQAQTAAPAENAASDDALLRELGSDYEQAESSAASDPLEPVNRLMFTFNDTLYVYALRPVARGYAWALPKPVRTGIDGVFYNLRYPGRLVNNLLQARFVRALKETGRFLVNTCWGLLGFFEPADSVPGLQQAPPKKDTGMTLATWGLGEGFYIVWPVFGPSTARDSLGSVGDYFLDPLNYVEPWYVNTGISVEERINAISLRLGDYEELKKASLDPYTALRNAFRQHRRAQIEK